MYRSRDILYRVDPVDNVFETDQSSCLPPIPLSQEREEAREREREEGRRRETGTKRKEADLKGRRKGKEATEEEE